MSDLTERLVQAASDAVIAKWWDDMLDGPGPDELEGARFLAESIIPAVLRELAAGYRESAAAWVSRETEEQMRMDLRAARQISRLADEIEATRPTPNVDGGDPDE